MGSCSPSLWHRFQRCTLSGEDLILSAAYPPGLAAFHTEVAPYGTQSPPRVLLPCWGWLWVRVGVTGETGCISRAGPARKFTYYRAPIRYVFAGGNATSFGHEFVVMPPRTLLTGVARLTRQVYTLRYQGELLGALGPSKS